MVPVSDIGPGALVQLQVRAELVPASGQFGAPVLLQELHRRYDVGVGVDDAIPVLHGSPLLAPPRALGLRLSDKPFQTSETHSAELTNAGTVCSYSEALHLETLRPVHTVRIIPYPLLASQHFGSLSSNGRRRRAGTRPVAGRMSSRSADHVTAPLVDDVDEGTPVRKVVQVHSGQLRQHLHDPRGPDRDVR